MLLTASRLAQQKHNYVTSCASFLPKDEHDRLSTGAGQYNIARLSARVVRRSSPVHLVTISNIGTGRK